MSHRSVVCLAVCLAALAPATASAVPVVVADSNCFLAPLESSCVHIGYRQGPFAAPTDERSFAVIEEGALFGGPGIEADNPLLGPPPPTTDPSDFIRATAGLANGAGPQRVEIEVSGRHGLIEGAPGSGPFESQISARVNVSGRLTSTTLAPGTNVNLPTQIDHDGGISDDVTSIGTWQNGGSVAILWSAQANVLTDQSQTIVFQGNLGMNETDVAINASAGYVLTDSDLSGFAESYSNTTPIFSDVGLRIGEEFSLEVLIHSMIFHDATSASPSGDEIFNDFADTFRFALELPEGVSFEAVPEPSAATAVGAALAAFIAATRHRGRRRRDDS